MGVLMRVDVVAVAVKVLVGDIGTLAVGVRVLVHRSVLMLVIVPVGMGVRMAMPIWLARRRAGCSRGGS